MQKLIEQFQIEAWPQMSYGLTFLPDDFDPSKTYPLIIFLHGKGETGDGQAGTSNLLNTALPQLINQGLNVQATDPVSKQLFEFIVCCPQAPNSSGWSYGYGQVKNILPSIQRRYKIDPNRIYLTGISAGGAGVWSSVTNDDAFTKQIAAIVPVSAVGCNYPDKEEPNLPKVAKDNGVAVWGIAGLSDTYYNKTVDYVGRINAPGPDRIAIVTGLPGGHEPNVWNRAYDPNYFYRGHNIYEFMLANARNASSSTVVTPPVTPPAQKKLLFTIKVYDDGSTETAKN